MEGVKEYREIKRKIRTDEDGIGNVNRKSMPGNGNLPQKENKQETEKSIPASQGPDNEEMT